MLTPHAPPLISAVEGHGGCSVAGTVPRAAGLHMTTGPWGPRPWGLMGGISRGPCSTRRPTEEAHAQGPPPALTLAMHGPQQGLLAVPVWPRPVPRGGGGIVLWEDPPHFGGFRQRFAAAHQRPPIRNRCVLWPVPERGVSALDNTGNQPGASKPQVRLSGVPSPVSEQAISVLKDINPPYRDRGSLKDNALVNTHQPRLQKGARAKIPDPPA